MTAPVLSVPSPLRVGGVDPGSAWVAYCVLEGDALPCSFAVPPVTRQIGRMVDLARPRKLKSGAIRTTRRELTREDMNAIAAEVTACFITHRVELACIEWIDNANMGADGAKAAAMSTALIRTGQVAQAIATHLEAAGIPICSSTAAVWRRRVTGKNNASAEEIRKGIAGRIAWPEPGEIDEHGFDACGVAVQVLCPELPPVKRAGSGVGRGHGRHGFRPEAFAPKGSKRERLILRALGDGPLGATAISLATGISRTNVCTIAGVMQRRGLLVQPTRRGPYELGAEERAACDAWKAEQRPADDGAEPGTGLFRHPAMHHPPFDGRRMREGMLESGES